MDKSPVNNEDIDVEKKEKVCECSSEECTCSAVRVADDLSDDSGVTTDDTSINLASTQDDSQQSLISDIADNACMAQEIKPDEQKQESSDSNFVDDTDSQQSTTSSTSSSVSARKILKRRFEDSGEQASPSKKRKKSVAWDRVTIYYFCRTQGFTSVPSQGGSTLGMTNEHNHKEKLTLVEHATKLKSLHKKLLLKHRKQAKSHSSASEDSDCEKEEVSDEESDISDSDLENQYFLQPVSIRQRRAMLRASGVKKIDSVEKEECKNIRSSREYCGCNCKIYCDPETCLCSLAGIKCQVDRMSFPCGCTRDGCGNLSGRIEFNPIRVRAHLMHTLMRLELERRQDFERSKWRMAPTPTQTTPKHIYFSSSSQPSENFDNSAAYATAAPINCHPITYPTPSAQQHGSTLVFSQNSTATTTNISNMEPEDSYDVYSAFSPGESSYSETSECSSDSVTPPMTYLPPASAVFGDNGEHKYTDLSSATPAKYEPLSELINAAGTYSATRTDNAYEFTDAFSFDDKQRKIGSEGVDDSNVSSAASTDNFGEIIKKTMVETVSA